MRYVVLMITLVLAACNSVNDAGKGQAQFSPINFETILSSTGKMGGADYDSGTEEKVPVFLSQKRGFTIVVDTTSKAKNFISPAESYWRNEANKIDTDYLGSNEGWDQLSVKEKLQLVREERLRYRHEADSIHMANNSGKVQAWLVNDTRDTVSLQMQDGSFICILQAKVLGGWRPVEYLRLSECGNSYYLLSIKPRMANSFVVTIPNRGNFKTQLRYKLLGKDRYFYSNEFIGMIDKHEFVQHRSPGTDAGAKTYTWQLDTFVQLFL